MKYFVVINDEQQGPFSIEKLAQMGITPETEVWTDGMDDWCKAAEVPELTILLENTKDDKQPDEAINDNEYYVVINDEQQGPFSIDELAQMELSPNTEVWAEGMENWDKACNLPQLNEIFATEDKEYLENNDTEDGESLDDSSGKYRKISKKTILAISGVVLLLIVMMITNPSKHDHAEKVVRNCYTIMFQDDDYDSALFKGFYGKGWDYLLDRSNFLIFSICKHKINNEAVSFGILGMVFTFDDWYKRNIEENLKYLESKREIKSYDESRREINSDYEREKETNQGETHSLQNQSVDELSIITADSYIPENSDLAYNLIEEWSLALSRERLRTGQLDGIDSDFLKLMRNSIFARHGYRFKMERFSSFFNHYDWYNPQKDDVTSELSEIEKYNVNFIQKYE